MRKIFLAAACLLLCATAAGAGAPASVGREDDDDNKPCPVRKIYVAEFSRKDPRYLSFRLDLEKWLSKQKFTAVARPEDADAVLTGELWISSGGRHSRLSFTGAELKTAAGDVVWRGDFDRRTKNAWGWLGRGHIENGAKPVAEKMRAECGGARPSKP